MNSDQYAKITQSADDLKAIASLVYSSAQNRQSDNLALLALLRSLEQLHREICDGPFQDTLPKNRQALYNLLRDIETNGGWPYIPRMRLQRLFELLSTEDSDESSESHSDRQ